MVETVLTQSLPGSKWYNAFDRVGFYYGPTFQQLESTRTDCNMHQATGNIKVLESSGAMQGESRYLVHPSTVDACLQLIIVSIHAGKHKRMPWGVVPTRIEEISLFPAREDVLSSGHAVAWTDGFDQRRFNTHVRLTGSSGRILVQVKNLTCVTYEAALPAGGTASGSGSEPFSMVSWNPDFAALSTSDFKRLLPETHSRADCFGEMIDLISHRQVVCTVMVCGSPATDVVDKIISVLPSSAKLTIGLVGEQEIFLSEEVQALAIMKPLGISPDDWLQSTDEPYDIVLLDYPKSDIDTGLQTILRTSAYVVLDEDETASSESLVQTLLPLFPLMSLSSISTNLVHEDVVLSLPGPKYVMDMMGRLAKAAGWNLIVIVNSSEQREQHISQLGFHSEQILVGEDVTAVKAIIRRQYASSGAMTIVAHDFSLLSEEIWRSIPPACRFFLSETSIDIAPDFLPFARGASFICNNTKALRASAHSASDLLRSSSQLAKKYPTLLHSTAYTSIEIVDLEHISELPHTGAGRDNGAVVIRCPYGESQIEVRS